VHVVLISVQASGREIPVAINRPRTIIGRQTDCHIRIPANDVSRNHCEILIEDAEITVGDMGARNGTYVNGERIQGRHTLAAGDLVTVGPAVFVLQIDGVPGEVDSADAYQKGHVEPAGGGRGSIARGDDMRTSGGLLAGIGAGGSGDPDDSSFIDFEFDLNDADDDDQPPL
jgi:predicted component of type VI protein secretion system